MNQLKADTRLTLLSRIPVMLLSFISVIFLTRVLGPEGNGVYTFTMAVLNLFLTIVGFQLESSLPVFLAKEKVDKDRILSATVVLALLSVLAVAGILTTMVFLFPVGRRWVIPESQSATFFFLVIVVLFILRKTSAMIQAIFMGLFLFKAYNGYVLLIQGITTLAYGTLLFSTVSAPQSISVESCFKIILALETILMLIGIFILWQNKIISFSKNFTPFLKPIYAFSARNLLSSTGQFLNKRLDVWFVQYYRGTSSLGQYGLASQMVNFVSDAMTPLTQVMIPYLSGSSAETHKNIVERTARINMAIAFLASIGILGTSWFFIPLFFGPAFLPAVPASRILAVGLVFISLRLVFADYFKAIHQLNHPARAAWAGVLVTVTLDVLLIPKYGISGAAWATTLAYATSSLYLLVKAKSVLGFSLTHILFVKASDFRWLLLKK